MGGQLGTLPVKCRPRKRLIFNVNNQDKSARVDVETNGNVAWHAGGKDHAWLSLTGLTWPTVDDNLHAKEVDNKAAVEREQKAEAERSTKATEKQQKTIAANTCTVKGYRNTNYGGSVEQNHSVCNRNRQDVRYGTKGRRRGYLMQSFSLSGGCKKVQLW